MPLTFTTNDAVVAGLTMSWVVPVIALGLIPTATAYTLGIMGIARLRPRFASLVGLSEVMFAVLAAWVLLGELIYDSGHRRRRRAGRSGAGASGRPHREGRPVARRRARRQAGIEQTGLTRPNAGLGRRIRGGSALVHRLNRPENFGVIAARY